MEFAELFFQRYDVLYDFWLAGVWEIISEDQIPPATASQRSLDCLEFYGTLPGSMMPD